MANLPLILIIGAFIGCVVILAEPAVYVLTKQIETVSAGYIPRKLVLIFLALGVSIATFLSMLRIVIPAFQLWHILLPSYMIALTLSWIVPELLSVWHSMREGCIRSDDGDLCTLLCPRIGGGNTGCKRPYRRIRYYRSGCFGACHLAASAGAYFYLKQRKRNL